MKKVVISPTNAKAIAFFEDLNKKKEVLRKKIEAKINKAIHPSFNTSKAQ